MLGVFSFHFCQSPIVLHGFGFCKYVSPLSFFKENHESNTEMKRPLLKWLMKNFEVASYICQSVEQKTLSKDFSNPYGFTDLRTKEQLPLSGSFPHGRKPFWKKTSW